MPLVSYLISFILLVWLSYLTFIIYRLRQKSSKLAIDPASIDTASLKKINLVRFNPFDEIGGDQSFILVLLDSHNNGVVLTSLHNRDHTRVYAKSIKKGEGDNVSLSRDEKLAILKAIKD